MAVFKTGISLLALCMAAQVAYASVVQDLPGYSRLTVSSQFEALLTKNDQLRARLAADTELSRLVLGRAALQKQLVEGRLTLDEIAATYLSNPENKKNAVQGELGLLAQARAMLQRAIGAAESESARERAAQEIEDTLQQAGGDEAAARASKDVKEATIKVAIDLGADVEKPAHDEAEALVAEDVAADAEEEREDTAHDEDTRLADIDLNAVPQGEGVDANGWPIYMGVPEECPARNTQKRYTHSFTVLIDRAPPTSLRIEASGQPLAALNRPSVGGRFNVRPVTKLNAIAYRPIFLADGSHEYSVPFYTPIASNAQPDYAELGISARLVPTVDYTVSYCPGDFSGVTPTGKPKLFTGCSLYPSTGRRATVYYRTVAPETFKAMMASGQDNEGACVLEENTRYFLNIRPAQYAVEFAAEHGQSIITHEFKPRTENTGSNFRPPYVGPCKNGEPYAPHYSSSQCGEVMQAQLNPHTGESFNFGIDDRVREQQITHHCYDPYDLVSPWQVTFVGNNDTHMQTVTTGYGGKANSRYTCEFKRVQHMRDGAVETDNDGTQPRIVRNVNEGLPGVCAAHREGQVREWLCGTATTLTSTEHAQSGEVYLQRIQTAPNRRRIALEQCQFNDETQRYDWMIVEQQQNIHARQLSEVRCVGQVRDIMSDEEQIQKCAYKGQSYPIGTRLEGNDGTVWECRLGGVKRHTEVKPLPAFYPIKLMNTHGMHLQLGLFPKRTPGSPDTVVRVVPAAN